MHPPLNIHIQITKSTVWVKKSHTSTKAPTYEMQPTFKRITLAAVSETDWEGAGARVEANSFQETLRGNLRKTEFWLQWNASTEVISAY